jgi:outer membrane lipoprotein-sorting protein
VDRKRSHRRAAPRGLAFESLESRLLLSADLLPAADGLATGPSLVPAEHRALEALDPAPAISMQVAAHELVFVDGALPDLERLLADFIRATGADRPVEVIVLDPTRDGIEQIGEALAGRTGLTAVHVLSHGRDGAIELGRSTLDAATLAARADEVAAWASAFAAGGDLLLYGCDVADTLRGEAFLGELARLTGADVAASTNPTGAQALGGDWVLEFATGAIELELAPLAAPADRWGGLLAAETLDWDGAVTISQPGGGGTPYTTGAVATGTGTVTVAISGYAHNGTTGAVDNAVLGLLTSGTPVIDQSETGALVPGQNTLRIVSTGFEPDDPGDAGDGWQGFLITIDFSHAGGVSNVVFSIFDIDTGGSGNFIDEIVATSSQGAPTGTANSARNTVIAPGIVRGTASSAAGEGFGNATFTFAQSGITQIQIYYKNAGGQTPQGIALHDVSFHANDPPAIGGLGTLHYTENDPATVIAGGATVADPDSANFDAGTLTVAFAANGTAADQLAIRNEGTLAGQIGVSGATVTYGGVAIGTFAGGANGTSLVVTFNASATPAAAQALVRNITFANTSEDPSTLARTVRFTIADGDGGSAFANATVNVAAANDAPVLAGANALAGIAEDPAANPGTAVSVLIAGQVTDVDGGALRGIAVTAADGANGVWEFSLDGGTSWNPVGAPSASAALLLRDTDRVRFVPTADWNGTATIAFRAWDRTSGVAGATGDSTANGGTTAFSTATATSNITVSAVADAVNDATGTNEDNAVTFNVLANDTFENGGHLLTGVTGAANGGVSFTAAGAVTYTPNAHWSGTETLTYTVASGGVTETGTLTITVTPVADAPTLTVNAAAGNEDTAIALSVATALVDADGSEALSLAVSSIPIGATLSDGTNTFTATAGNTTATVSGWNLAALTVLPPPHSDVDFTLVVGATATETVGGSTATTTANLAVTVNAVADAPTLTVNPAAGDEDTVIALPVATALVDADGSETLAVAISSIPVGATLSDGANSFTATAGNTTATVSGWNLAALTVLPPLHSDTDFTLTFTATSTEAANLATATVSADLAVTVDDVADAPTLTVIAASGDEDTAIALSVATALVDTDGSETLSLSVASIPIGAVLADGANSFTASLGNTTAVISGWNLAQLRVTPPLHGDAGFTLVVGATATETVGGSTATTTANLAVTVNAVADAPTLTVNPAAGDEDTAIALPVATALVDADGSETLAVAISSIPVGATLSDGANSFTATAGNTTATVSGWNLAALTVLPPLHSDVDFTLTVTSTATEGANGAVATTTSSLAVTVNAVADAPTLTVNPAAGDEDTVIALPVATALVDADGSETLAVTISSIPVGATLSDGAFSFTASAGNQAVNVTGWNLAALTVTPPLHSDADFTLSVTATSTEAANLATATTSANLAVTVNAVADAPTLTVSAAAGDEDTAIALSVATALVDTDGSETLSISLSAIPVGATLSDGAFSFTASAGNQAVNVTGWNLAALTITPPPDADTDFTLTVSATATEGANANAATTVAALAVDVLPVNDAPTATAPAVIDVVEDVPSPLLGISFADVDAYAGLVTATFTVVEGTLSASAGGGVAVGGTATALTLTGTLAGVNAFLAGGALRYTTVLDGNAPVALAASLNDLGNTGAGGPLASPVANVTLNVIPVNDAPVLGSVTLDIDAGGTVVLTAANLSATDVDDPAAGLVFMLAGVANGRFELAGNPGVPVFTFTQGQVTAGQVRFVHTDPVGVPSYRVFVTDGVSTVGPGIVALTFRSFGGLDETRGAREDAGLPAVSVASRTLDTSGNGLADPFAIRFNRQPVVSTDDGGAATPEPETVAPAVGGRQGLATPGALWELRSRGVAVPDLGFGQMDKLPTAIPPLDFAVGPQRPHEEPRGFALALDAVRTAGLVVSVGAVWWASRAVGLLSSLLAITPTWRHIDPLPVLGRDDDEPVGGWEEPASEEAAEEEASANEMFDGGTKKPASV